jgi:SOS-response transcriptional repressor LexA
VGVARVRGDSMLPTLAPGDRLLVRYGARVRPGRLVLARLADGTLAVKRATERRTSSSGRLGWWLASDNPAAGVDSRHRGPVPDADVLAVVVARLWPRPCPWQGLRATAPARPDNLAP